jgi:hypothetical protein
VIHFDDDTEELQQWDQQVSSVIHFYDVRVMGGHHTFYDLHSTTPRLLQTHSVILA